MHVCSQTRKHCIMNTHTHIQVHTQICKECIRGTHTCMRTLELANKEPRTHTHTHMSVHAQTCRRVRDTCTHAHAHSNMQIMYQGHTHTCTCTLKLANNVTALTCPAAGTSIHMPHQHVSGKGLSDCAQVHHFLRHLQPHIPRQRQGPASMPI